MKNIMIAVKDPREIPTYAASDVARFFNLPVSTARAWMFGQSNFTPLISLPDPELRLISFYNLVELHVISFTRRKRNLSLTKIRRAIDYMKNRFGHENPFAHASFKTDGVDLFVEVSGKLLNISRGGQLAMKSILERYLERIEHDSAGMPKRLYLFTRTTIEDSPKTVMIDPHISFGRPVLSGTGITTAILSERFYAGESLEDLAFDYGCDARLIEEAIRCEPRPIAA